MRNKKEQTYESICAWPLKEITAVEVVNNHDYNLVVTFSPEKLT